VANRRTPALPFPISMVNAALFPLANIRAGVRLPPPFFPLPLACSSREAKERRKAAAPWPPSPLGYSFSGCSRAKVWLKPHFSQFPRTTAPLFITPAHQLGHEGIHLVFLKVCLHTQAARPPRGAPPRYSHTHFFHYTFCLCQWLRFYIDFFNGYFAISNSAVKPSV